MNIIIIMIYAMIGVTVALSAWLLIDARKYKLKGAGFKIQPVPISGRFAFEALRRREADHGWVRVGSSAALIVDTNSSVENSFVGIFGYAANSTVTEAEIRMLEQEIRSILRDARVVKQQKRRHLVGSGDQLGFLHSYREIAA